MLICAMPTNVKAEEDITKNTGYVAPILVTEDEVSLEQIWNQDIIKQYRSSSNYDWNIYSVNYYYNKLSNEEKNLWNTLDNMCNNYLTTSVNAYTYDSATGHLPYVDYGEFGLSYTREEIQNIILVFVYSNPQYYFLNEYTFANVETGIVALGIYPEFVSGSTRASYTKQFQGQVDEWLKEIKSVADTDLDKEKEAHDLLCDELTYSGNTYDQSCVSAMLFEHKTVCARYTKAYTLLLRGLGINVIPMTSSTHAWNEVEVDNQWYVVDTTWDDQISYIMYGAYNTSYNNLQSRYGTAYHNKGTIWESLGPVTATSDYYKTMLMNRVCKPTISVQKTNSGNKIYRKFSNRRKFGNKSSGNAILFSA